MTLKLRPACEEGAQPWEDLGNEHSRPWEPGDIEPFEPLECLGSRWEVTVAGM